MIKIPEEAIRKRLQKLNNYEKVLYPQMKERSDRLRVENQALKADNERLRRENEQIEKLRLELEELRAMKFGKKREKIQHVKAVPIAGEKEKTKRSAESYRRTEPNREVITDYLHLELEECPECGEKLMDKKEHIHYREDLYEVENLLKSAKKIVQTIVESGKCPACKQRQFAMEIPKQTVLIGQNIRIMIVYMIIVQGQSYSEARKSMKHQYGIALSEGEIVNILEGESVLITPYYNELVERLEHASGSHYDETSWKTKDQGTEVSEGNYCWVKAAVENQDKLIWFGCSRGKGVAEKLRGEKKESIGVSDDYGAYKNLFDHHQLCWAHPHRKLRDLSESSSLSGKAKKVCQKACKDFADVYEKSRKVSVKLKEKSLTDEAKAKEREKLEQLFEVLFEPTAHDPKKLQTIRQSLKERKERYFTFFDFPYLPLDNNKAERAVRRIVIKRKKSFGCKSQKGANVLSILYSVVFSFLDSNPDQSFFTLYRQVMDYEGGQ